MAFKTEAIILREKHLKGADRIYDILCPYEGRISVVARSVAKSSSKMAGHLSPFSHVKMMVGRGRQDHLAGVRTINSHRALRSDWFNFILASSLVELVLRVNVPGQAAKEEFELLQKAFDVIIRSDKSTSAKASVGRIFLWKMLALSGWKPNISQCSQCQKNLLTDHICYQAGKGFVCQKHFTNGISLNNELMDYIDQMIHSEDWHNYIDQGTTAKLGKNWLKVSQLYYTDIISYPLQSLKLFNYAS